MAKKKTWFGKLKRLFISEPQKKDKRKRWASRLLKMKEIAPFSAPSPPRERLPWETAEQSNSALPVTIATETLEMRQIPSDAQSTHQLEESQEESAKSSIYDNIPQPSQQELAATQIQAAFRGLLARKALRALKGVVMLQALIRGWVVRQQTINTLKCLQSIVNIQSEVCLKRCESSKDSLHCHENKSQDLKGKDIKVDMKSQKWGNDRTLTEEELKALFLNKSRAFIKRERVKEYLNHQRSEETEGYKAYGRQVHQLEQWVDTRQARSNRPGNTGGTTAADLRNRDEVAGRLPNLRYLQQQYQAEMSCSPTYIPRRSYQHRKQRSVGNKISFPASLSIPAYMASTESAKAKARSLSSPRQRPHRFDVCSEIPSPCKHKVSPVSSINSEQTGSSWVGNHTSSSQRSPRWKGLPGPVKSSTSTKDVRRREALAPTNDASLLAK